MEATSWRQIETNTYPNLHRYSLSYPGKYQPECPTCSSTPTVYHITWECNSNWREDTTPEKKLALWEAALASSSLEDQLHLVNLAREKARLSGVLDWGPHPLATPKALFFNKSLLPLLLLHNHLITALRPLSADCTTCERGISGGEGNNRCDNPPKRGVGGGEEERGASLSKSASLE